MLLIFLLIWVENCISVVDAVFMWWSRIFNGIVQWTNFIPGSSLTWVGNKFPSMLMFDADALGLLILCLKFICGFARNSVAIDCVWWVLLTSEFIVDGNLLCFTNFLWHMLHCEFMCHTCLREMKGALLQTCICWSCLNS